MDDGKSETFKTELGAYSGVVRSAFYGGEPGSTNFRTFILYQTSGIPEGVSVNTYLGDPDYLDLMGMKIIQGRKFDRNLASDTASIILNEAAVMALGLPEDPIGAVVNQNDKVIGVVSDFHWESLHNSIAPAAIRLTRGHFQIGFKLEAGSVKDFIAAAEKKWKEIVPDKPFNYHFVDANFSELLKKDEIFGKAINFFTLLAIFISCLGLYGLSAFTAEQRTKEIGIRKVFGASSSQIVLMLNRKFTVLVTIAVVISIPVATWLVSKWLEGFAYKIVVGAGVF